jgi:hypothetical protein
MTSVYVTLQDVAKEKHTFAERIGPPDECTSALGHVIVGFSWLEESIEKHIAALAQASPTVAPALTSELSFKMKVSVLSSLVRIQPPLRAFNVGTEKTQDVWADIVKMLFASEELRNQLLHSHWLTVANKSNLLRRTKTTAKAARGVHVVSEDLTSEYIIDVYDYILIVESVLEEFFLTE